MNAGTSACLLDTLLAAEVERSELPTSQPLSDATCQEIDMAMHQFKQPVPGNPLVDGYEAERQARAIAIERGNRRRS